MVSPRGLSSMIAGVLTRWFRVPIRSKQKLPSLTLWPQSCLDAPWPPSCLDAAWEEAKQGCGTERAGSGPATYAGSGELL